MVKSYLLILIYSNYSYFFTDEKKMLFKFHITTKYAYSPIVNKESSLGFDIKIPYDYFIPKKSGITVHLDLTFTSSENCYAIIASTSILSRDYFLCV
jgi:hypothetical protein